MVYLRYRVLASGVPNCQVAYPMITLIINRITYHLDVNPSTPLLWVIRDIVGLTGTKFGCGISQCGACTIHLNGKAVRACTCAASFSVDKEITTIEGLTGELAGRLRAIWQTANVTQCGYCQPGQIMAAAHLLTEHPHPTDAEINSAMSGNLCRCGTYQRIRRAIRLVASGIDGEN